MHLLLKNANVVDVGQDVSFHKKDILIDGNRISMISCAIPEEKAETTIDLTGKWVFPGMINMHEHQSYKRLVGPLYGPNGSCTGLEGVDLGIRAVRSSLFSIKSGITTICEMGALHNLSVAMKKAVNRKVIPGPRMFISDQHLTTVGGHSHELAREIADSADMEKAVYETLGKGCEWVKLLTSHEPVKNGNDGIIQAEMSEELVSVAVRIAHANGARVAVHAMGQMQLDRVISAGVDAIHHAAFLSPEQAAKMKEKGIALVSTISAYRNTSSPSFERGEAWAKENLPLRPGLEMALKSALNAGVLIAPGTDSLGDLIDELLFMNEYGMSLPECLKSVTINAAEILGQKDSLGSLEEGKLADMVILDKDPTASLENLRAISFVIKDGEVYHLENLSLENTDPKWFLEKAPRV